MNHLPVIPPNFIHEGMMVARGIWGVDTKTVEAEKPEVRVSGSESMFVARIRDGSGKDSQNVTGKGVSRGGGPRGEKYPGAIKDGLLSTLDLVKVLWLLAFEP